MLADLPVAIRDRFVFITLPSRADFTAIGQLAFYQFHYLTGVTLSTGLTSIGASAFNSCTRLAAVTLPNSLTFIEEAAFSSCSALTAVTIPTNVTSIGVGAFGSCSKLSRLTFTRSTAPTVGGLAFTNTALATADGSTVFAPGGATGAYSELVDAGLVSGGTISNGLPAADKWSDYP
jgi:hypothetical protein